MARMHKPLLGLAGALAVALLIGAVVWLRGLSERDRGLPAPIAGAAPSETSAHEPARDVVAPDAPPDDVDSTDTLVAWPVEVDLELERAADDPRAADVDPRGSGATARLSGRITDARGGGVAARVTFVAGPNAGRTLEADPGGEFGASGLLPGLGIVQVAGPGILGSVRQVRLRQGVTTELNLSYGAPSQVWVTVHDDAGQPLEGAKVEMDGQEAFSDENGDAYFAQMTCGNDIVIVISKAGFSTYQGLLGVSFGYHVPRGKVQYRLARGCKLNVVVESPGRGLATVFVMPDNPLAKPQTEQWALGGHPVDARDYPWYRSGLRRVSSGSVATFEDLPPRRVAVHVFHAGAVAEPAFQHVTLDPDRTATVTVRMKPAPRLRGRVVRDGEPVAGAKVVLEAPDRTAATLQYFKQTPWFLESIAFPALPMAVQETETDGSGEFVLTAWSELARARYLRAETRDGLWRAARIVRAGDAEVELELERVEEGGGRIEVEFPGRIQGLPVRLKVNGRPRPEVVLPVSQNLVVTDLAPGRWSLRARWNGETIVERDRFDLEDEAVRVVPLPEGAILGQDEETVRRARGEPN